RNARRRRRGSTRSARIPSPRGPRPIGDGGWGRSTSASRSPRRGSRPNAGSRTRSDPGSRSRRSSPSWRAWWGIGLYQGLNSYLRGGGSLAAGAITAVCFVALFAYLARKNLRALWQAVKQFALPLTAYKGAALAIAATLARRGEVPE